jgi:hypothetical protein
LAGLLKTVINDEKRDVAMRVAENQEGAQGDQGGFTGTPKEFDFADYREFNKADRGLGAVLIAHALDEQYQFLSLEDAIRNDPLKLGNLPHIRAYYFESKVLSDYTGAYEKPRQDSSSVAASPPFFRFIYTTIGYDIYWKAGTVTNIQGGAVGNYDAVDRIIVRHRLTFD